jgi:hypothetical protein
MTKATPNFIKHACAGRTAEEMAEMGNALYQAASILRKMETPEDTAEAEAVLVERGNWIFQNLDRMA